MRWGSWNMRTYRPIPLALTMLTLFSTSPRRLGGHDAAAHGDEAHAATVSNKELALRQDMRKL